MARKRNLHIEDDVTRRVEVDLPRVLQAQAERAGKGDAGGEEDEVLHDELSLGGQVEDVPVLEGDAGVEFWKIAIQPAKPAGALPPPRVAAMFAQAGVALLSGTAFGRVGADNHDAPAPDNPPVAPTP